MQHLVGSDWGVAWGIALTRHIMFKHYGIAFSEKSQQLNANESRTNNKDRIDQFTWDPQPGGLTAQPAGLSQPY
eukprot:1005888-Pelagomonas_calceolata.AAC.1